MSSVGAGAAEPAVAKRPSGRRRGDSGTRQAILDAAREQFSAYGYRGATMRSIGKAAGVDPALIRHYFGGKDDLFAATLDFPDDLPERLTEALAGPPEHAGERVVRSYLALWEDPVTSAPLLAMLRSVIDTEQAADLLRQFIRARILDEVVPGLGVDRPELRITLAGSQLLGTALGRYVLRAHPLADVGREELIAVLAPSIQRFLTGDLPTVPGQG